MENVSWCIPIDKIYDTIMSDPKRFEDSEQVIAEYAYDDDDKKWYIFAIKQRDNDSVDIILDTMNGITTSANCASQSSIQETVNAFLEAVI